MSDFTAVAKVGSILPGRGEAFAVNGRMVAVFNMDGQYRAMDDTCPHMGASPSGGLRKLNDGRAKGDRPGPSDVAPRKTKHISFVVCSPIVTRRGGWLGLLKLASLLS